MSSARPVVYDFSYLVDRLNKVLRTFVAEDGKVVGDPDETVRVLYRSPDEHAWRRVPVGAVVGQNPLPGHYRAELLSAPEDDPNSTVLKEITAELRPFREEEHSSPIAYVRACNLSVENAYLASSSLREANGELRSELREARDEIRSLRERLAATEAERDALRHEREDDDVDPLVILAGLKEIFRSDGPGRDTPAQAVVEVVEVVRKDDPLQTRLRELGFERQLRALGCGQSPDAPPAPEPTDGGGP